MKDGIIKGIGASRRIYAHLPATYEEFRMQAANGTLEMDVLFNALGWSQQPDFLNRKNLLQGSTANLYGLTDDAVPNDALYAIGRLNSGLGNEFMWSRTGTEYTPKLSPALTESEYEAGAQLQYSQNVVYNKELSAFELVNPEVATISDTNADYSFLNDKYIQSDSKTVEYCLSTNSGEYLVVNSKRIIGADENINCLQYVNSPDETAYPPNPSDGYDYALLGKLGAAAHPITGSYTGNGETEKTLTFNKLPSFLVVTTASPNLVASSGSWIFWIPGVTRSNTANSSNPFAYTNIEVSGNSIKLIGQASGLEVDDIAALAFNYKDRTYHYFYVV